MKGRCSHRFVESLPETPWYCYGCMRYGKGGEQGQQFFTASDARGRCLIYRMDMTLLPPSA